MTRAAGRRNGGRAFDIVLLGLPLAFLVVFSAVPVAYTVVMSLQTVDMFSLLSFHRPFAGLQNYVDLFHRRAAERVFINTATFTVASVSAQLVIGFALALFFQRRFPGAATIRGAFLAAWIMPGLVVGAIWKWIFAGDNGVLNAILSGLHLVHAKPFWLSDPDLSLSAVVIANVWLGIPFNMILLSVGLAAVPADLYEAARMDGAGPVRQFVSVTLPMMRATIGAVAALGVILTLQQYDLISGLTEGGPANSSNVAQYWSWQLSFQTYEISAGSALAVVMLGITALVAGFYIWSTRQELSA